MITKKILHWVKFKQLEVNGVPFLKFCSLGALEVFRFVKESWRAQKKSHLYKYISLSHVKRECGQTANCSRDLKLETK